MWLPFLRRSILVAVGEKLLADDYCGGTLGGSLMQRT